MSLFRIFKGINISIGPFGISTRAGCHQKIQKRMNIKCARSYFGGFLERYMNLEYLLSLVIIIKLFYLERNEDYRMALINLN